MSDIMPKKEMDELLHKATTSRLATYDGKTPYVVPVCFIYYHGNIFLHSAYNGEKMQNIRMHPQVCLQVDEVDGLITDASVCKYNFAYRSVIIRGEASLIENSEQKQQLLTLLTQKYAGTSVQIDFTAKQIENVAVVKIEFHEITGKKNG